MEKSFETKEISIDEIIPSSYNPRKISKEEKEKLKKEIEEFGLVEPLILNERNKHLVGGHQRLAILKELGWNKVPYWAVNLDKQKEMALNLALNKLGGEWDQKLLSEVITSLQETNFDMEITGFDISEIDKILNKNLAKELESQIPAVDLGSGEGIEPNLKASAVKMIQLTFNQEQYNDFISKIQILSKRYSKTNTTETVMEAINREHAQTNN